MGPWRFRSLTWMNQAATRRSTMVVLVSLSLRPMANGRTSRGRKAWKAKDGLFAGGSNRTSKLPCGWSPRFRIEAESRSDGLQTADEIKRRFCKAPLLVLVGGRNNLNPA